MRRGYFVAGLGAAQFAQPGAVDLLRAARDAEDEPGVVTLSATDPANPYGVLVPWPLSPPPATDAGAATPRGATRTVGARIVLVDGQLAAWIARGGRALTVALPDDEPDRSRVGRALARELVALAHRAPEGQRGWLIEDINGQPAAAHPIERVPDRVGFRGHEPRPATARAADWPQIKRRLTQIRRRLNARP